MIYKYFSFIKASMVKHPKSSQIMLMTRPFWNVATGAPTKKSVFEDAAERQVERTEEKKKEETQIAAEAR
jgi:hypothetical protein